MEIFEYAHRTDVICGTGAIARLGEAAARAGMTRVLVVTDPGVAGCGHAERGAEAVRREGIRAEVFDGVRENPTTQVVAAAIEAAKKLDADGFVGLGGGSSMDTAKAANLLFTHGGRFADYVGENKLRKPVLPTVTVPTTAGTGSEVQSAALISDPQTHRKMLTRDPRLAPRVAILDPELTETQPLAVAAATGIDAMTHAIESFVTTRRNPVSRMFALGAWRRISRGIDRVLDAALSADDAAQAREDMLLGAALAGAAIENSMLGAAHAASNPLTARYGITHGVAVGLMLPPVIHFNAQAVDGSYAALAATAGLDAASNGDRAAALAERVSWIVHGSPVETSLRSLGARPDDFAALAADAASQWTAQCNPRPIEATDFLALYRQAYEQSA